MARYKYYIISPIENSTFQYNSNATFDICRRGRDIERYPGLGLQGYVEFLYTETNSWELWSSWDGLMRDVGTFIQKPKKVSKKDIETYMFLRELTS